MIKSNPNSRENVPNSSSLALLEKERQRIEQQIMLLKGDTKSFDPSKREADLRALWGSVKTHGDIVAPIDVPWEADQ